jgi:hypothetical protein
MGSHVINYHAVEPVTRYEALPTFYGVLNYAIFEFTISNIVIFVEGNTHNSDDKAFFFD